MAFCPVKGNGNQPWESSSSNAAQGLVASKDGALKGQRNLSRGKMR